jgi:hypothetical protein
MSTDTFGPRRLYIESRHRVLADLSANFRDPLYHPAKQRLQVRYAACNPSGTPLTLANVQSMTLRLRASRTAEDVLAEAVTESITNTVTLAQWTAGTHQHALFELSAAQLNLLDGDKPEQRLWVTIQALIDDGGTPYTLLLLADYFELWEDGSSAADPPPENQGTAATLDDVEALLNERQLPPAGLEGYVLSKASDDDFDTEWRPPGSGSGDVVGPSGATSGNFASFSSTTGKAIADSGASAASFATAAQGGLADSAVQPGDLGGAALLDVGTSAGTVAAGDDSRLSDARTPTAHASTHATAGGDPLTPADIGAEVAGAAAAVAGDLSTHEGLTTTAHGGIVASDDSRLTDARTPTAHASSHTNGTDDIQSATASQKGLATAAQITKLDGIATGANLYTHPNHSGDVTSVGDGATTIANDAVTFAKMQNIASERLVGRHAGGSGNAQEVTVGNGLEFQGSGIRRSALTGDVTASAGNNATTIANDAVSYAKMQNVSAASRLLGRGSASGAGDPEEITLGAGLSMTGTELAATGGAGLTEFTEARSTAAPNATVPVHSLTAAGTETNIDAAIVPKGSGAFSLQVADNTSAGGNKRGAHAVDLQTSRTNAAQVASGGSSFVAGQQCTASGTGGVAMGNGSSAVDSVAIGVICNASGSRAVALGDSNVASGTSAVALGSVATASASYAFAQGRWATANRATMFARQGERFGAAGDAQWGQVLLHVATTDATATEMFLGAAANQRITLANNQTLGFRARIVARQQGANDTAIFERRGLITRDANAASTAIVGSVLAVSSDIGSNSGDPPAGWAVAFSADTTNGALKVEVTGAAATNIRWMCDIDFNEVIYA